MNDDWRPADERRPTIGRQRPTTGRRPATDDDRRPTTDNDQGDDSNGDRRPTSDERRTGPHIAAQDALVTAFEGPFGKALAAYVVTDPSTDWQQQPTSLGEQHMHKPPGESPEAGGDKDLVSAWGAVYDEMYQDSTDLGG